MTLYEPPPELAERYLKGDEGGLKAFEEFYGDVEGVEFEISDIPQAMERARKKRLAPQTLWKVVEDHITDRAIAKINKELRESGAGLDQDALLKKFAGSLRSVRVRASELAVHIYNVRIVPHVEASAKHFLNLSVDGTLATPLLVVPVAPEDEKLQELHVKMFEMVEKRIEEEAQKDEGLKRLITQKGIGEAMRGLTGYRKLMREDGEIIFAEDDPLRQITGVKKPKYFIIDGQLRALAMWSNLSQGRGEDEAYVWIIDDAEPVTVVYLSTVLNTGLREISNLEIGSFLAIAGMWNRVTFSRFAERIGSLVMRDKIESIDVRTLVSTHSFVFMEHSAKVVGLFPELAQPSEEEGKREERRWERREEPVARTSGVSIAQRQTTPTFSYASAQQLPAQMPMSPPAQPVREEVQRFDTLPSTPVREEVQRPGALPSTADVLAEFLWKQKQPLLLLASGNEAKLTIDFSHLHPTLQHRIAKKLGSLKLERTVVAVPFDKLSMKLNDIELLTSGYFLFYKTKQGLLECPNPSCRALVPLGPIRCLRCGQLIEDASVLPFPYEFSFSSTTSK
jgi:hypothetical protein